MTHCSKGFWAVTWFGAAWLLPANATVLFAHGAGVDSRETQARPHAVGVGALPRGAPASQRKLDGSLREVAQRYPEMTAADALHALRAINPSARFRLLMTESIPRVLVDAVADGDTQALRLALERLGFMTTATYANDVGGWLPVNELANAAALGQLRLMRASRPRTRAGAVMTQGDFAQRSDLVRASTATGLSGAGVTVGVLSDSFDCYPVYRTNGVPVTGAEGYAPNGITTDYAQDIASGDLPSGVSILEEANCLDYDPGELTPFGDEGRAMLQIVHDVAPGAKLAFYTAELSEADFAMGIQKLAVAGARVIIDDVGYGDEPVFQDGLLAQAVDDVNSGQKVAYFSAAGNDARNSIEISAPSFATAAASNAPNAGEELLNFDASGATTTTVLPVTIPVLLPGQFINFTVEWDQPFVTGASGSPGASSSVDICIIDSSGTTSCEGLSTVGQDPVNILTWLNPASSGANSAAEQVGIQIGLAPGGGAPHLIKLLVDDNGAGATINAFQTHSATLQGHPGAAGAIAVGAANYLATPLCGTAPAILETFSSAGGDPILFDTKGNRLATPQIRNKPDLVAPDGVNNTFLGIFQPPFSSFDAECRNNSAFPSFFGTSAAAPHVGAAAALLLQARPTATPAQIYTALRTTTVEMGSAGFDFDTGYGFIQADAALSELVSAVAGGASTVGPGTQPPNAPSGGGSLGVPELVLMGLVRLLLMRPRAGL
jgi:hypothetical protein